MEFFKDFGNFLASKHGTLFSPQLVHDFYSYGKQTVWEYIASQIETSLDKDEAQKLTKFIANSREKFSELITNECRVELKCEDDDTATTSSDNAVFLLEFKQIYKIGRLGISKT